MLVELFVMNPYFWLLCLAGLLLHFNYSRRKLYWASWQLPGPNPALPLVGNSLFILRNIGNITDVIALFDREVNNYTKKNGIGRLWLGPWLYIFIDDPLIAHELNKKTQLKSEEYQYLAKPFIRTGLFVTNDLPFYRHVKKAYLLGLAPDNLKSMIPHFHTECLRVVDTFRKYFDKKQSVFTGEHFKFLALSCVFKGAFGFDVHTRSNEQNGVFLKSIESLLQFLQLRILVPPLRQQYVHSLVGTRKKELEQIDISLAYMKHVMESYKDNKRRDNSVENKTNCKEYNDLVLSESFMDHLMGEELQLTEEEILANMFIMVVAGTDTVASQCTMLLILLAQNPLVQQKVYEELVQIVGDNINSCPTLEDLNKMEYLDRTIKECLRMFPAAPIIGRTVLEDITLTGSDGKEYPIPVGATIGILIRNIQNNPRYYENPTEFDPDRWLPENVVKRLPGSYLPFNNGVRKCVGGRYALLLMKTMAVTVLRAFDIVTSKSCEKYEDIHVEMSMTLKIGENCRIVLRERKINCI